MQHDQHPQHPHNGSAQMDPAATRSESPAAESQSNDGAMDRRVLLGFAGLAGVAALAKLAQAGPLEPPPGPISSTGSTLAQIYAKTSEAENNLSAIDRKVARTPSGISEPRIPITACPPSAAAQFVITQPGAYYLPSNLPQVQGQVCIDIQCSDVDIDGQGFSFIGTGNSASPPSTCIRCVGQSNIELYDCAFVGWAGDCCGFADCDDCCIRDVSFRHCTCPNGLAADGTVLRGALIRCGNGACVDDCIVRSSSGGMYCGTTSHFRMIRARDSFGNIRCGDGACVESCSVHGGQSAGAPAGSPPEAFIQCGDASSMDDCDVRNSQGLAFSCGSSCVIDCCDVSGGSGGAFRCADGCCLDGCTVLSHNAGAATCVVANLRTRINELEMRLCSAGILCHVGADSLVECCEITGGTSSVAIQCDSGCSVEDCSVINHAGASITTLYECTICHCRCVGGFSGISCAADCVIEDNECSVAQGGTSGGGGPAIAVSGPRGKISCNYIRRGGIIIFGGANYCTIEENTVLGGDGPPGTDGGFIAIAQGVTGCTVLSNSIRRGSMSSALSIPAGNTFGPIVNAISGGELDTLAGGTHPDSNIVH